MSATRWLEHVTITTGHSRRSYLDEVSDEALALCRRLIEQLRSADPYDVPILRTPYELPGYVLTGYVRRGRCLIVTIAADEPVVTMAVGAHSRCGARVWREIHQYADEWELPYVTDRDRPPPEPWCAALLDRAAARDPAERLMALALGEFERCLAWAWLTREHC
jgi:hypothetical protein